MDTSQREHRGKVSNGSKIQCVFRFKRASLRLFASRGESTGDLITIVSYYVRISRRRVDAQKSHGRVRWIEPARRRSWRQGEARGACRNRLVPFGNVKESSSQGGDCGSLVLTSTSTVWRPVARGKWRMLTRSPSRPFRGGGGDDHLERSTPKKPRQKSHRTEEAPSGEGEFVSTAHREERRGRLAS